MVWATSHIIRKSDFRVFDQSLLKVKDGQGLEFPDLEVGGFECEAKIKILISHTVCVQLIYTIFHTQKAGFYRINSCRVLLEVLTTPIELFYLKSCNMSKVF